MSSTVARESYARRHRTALIVLGLLVVLYVGSSIWHRVNSYDYTDRAVAAYDKATARGEDVGVITTAQDESFSDKTLAEARGLAGRGNVAFEGIFTKIAAEDKNVDLSDAERTSHENTCFVYPVVPHKGDPISKIVGLSRNCFSNDDDSQPYSGTSLAISNR